MTPIELHRFAELVAELANDGEPVGVFADHRRPLVLRFAPASSPKVEEACVEGRLVGVYGPGTTIEQVMDDATEALS